MNIFVAGDSKFSYVTLYVLLLALVFHFYVCAVFISK